MAKITIQVEVEEKSYQVAEAVKSLIKSAKDALADGFQPGSDLPKIVGENLGGMLGAIANLSAVAGEAGDDLEAFMKAWSLAGIEVAAMFLKKTPVAPAMEAPAPAPVAAAAPAAEAPPADQL